MARADRVAHIIERDVVAAAAMRVNKEDVAEAVLRDLLAEIADNCLQRLVLDSVSTGMRLEPAELVRATFTVIDGRHQDHVPVGEGIGNDRRDALTPIAGRITVR